MASTIIIINDNVKLGTTPIPITVELVSHSVTIPPEQGKIIEFVIASINVLALVVFGCPPSYIFSPEFSILPGQTIKVTISGTCPNLKFGFVKFPLKSTGVTAVAPLVGINLLAAPVRISGMKC